MLTILFNLSLTVSPEEQKILDEINKEAEEIDKQQENANILLNEIAAMVESTCESRAQGKRCNFQPGPTGQSDVGAGSCENNQQIKELVKNNKGRLTVHFQGTNYNKPCYNSKTPRSENRCISNK